MSSGADDGSVAGSTLEGVSGLDEQRRAAHGLWLRRATVAILVVIIAAAGSGFLGAVDATSSAQRDGYRVDVTYARVARAGLDAPMTIRVRAPRPIVKGIAIGVSADYFRMLAGQGFVPEPTGMATDSDTVYLTFPPPRSGNVVVVEYHATIQPAVQQGRSASIQVRVDGAWRVSTTIHTTLIP